MALIVKPNTFVPGTVIRSAEVNDNDDTIYNEFNGLINEANLTTLTGTVSWSYSANVDAIANERTPRRERASRISTIVPTDWEAGRNSP